MAKIRLKDATIRIIAPVAIPANPAILGDFARCELKIGDGTASWTENRAVEYVLDRGAIFHASQTGANAGKVTAYTRFGDETPMEVSFDFIFDSYAIYGGEIALTYPNPASLGPIELLKGQNALPLAGDSRKPFLKPTTVTPYSVDSVLAQVAPGEILEDEAIPVLTPPAVFNSFDACAPYCVDVLISFTKNCGGETAEHYLFKYFRWTGLDYDLSAGQISVSGQCQKALAKNFSY